MHKKCAVVEKKSSCPGTSFKLVLVDGSFPFMGTACGLWTPMVLQYAATGTSINIVPGLEILFSTKQHHAHIYAN